LWLEVVYIMVRNYLYVERLLKLNREKANVKQASGQEAAKAEAV
jgi:hypothetical protein